MGNSLLIVYLRHNNKKNKPLEIIKPGESDCESLSLALVQRKRCNEEAKARQHKGNSFSCDGHRQARTPYHYLFFLACAMDQIFLKLSFVTKLTLCCYLKVNGKIPMGKPH